MDETQTIMIKGQTLIIPLMSVLEQLHQLLEVGIRTAVAFQTLKKQIYEFSSGLAHFFCCKRTDWVIYKQ